MNKTILAFVLFCLSQGLFSQSEDVFQVSAEVLNFDGFCLEGEDLLLFQDILSDVLHVDLETMEVDTLSVDTHFTLAPRIIGNHVFAMSPDSSYAVFRLNIFHVNGQQVLIDSIHILDPANIKYKLTHEASEGRFYFTGYKGGKHVLWESDGSASGTRVIAEFDERVSFLKEFNDQLFILLSEGVEKQAFRYKYGEGVSSIGTLPTGPADNRNREIIQELGRSKDHLYLQLTDTANIPSIWRTNLEPGGTEIFLPDLSVRSITFEGKKFRYTTRQNGQTIMRQGNIDSPEEVDELRLLQSLSSEEGPGYFIQLIGQDHRFLLGVPETGLELAIVNQEDSLELLADLAEGARSGYPFHYHWDLHSLHDQDGNLILPMSNGQDGHNYLYRISDSSFTSLARLDQKMVLKMISRSGNDLYWLEQFSIANGEDTVRIRKISLTGAYEQQPLSTEIEETWLREIGIITPVFGFIDYNQLVIPKNIVADEEGSVIAGFLLREFIWDQNPIYSISTEKSRKERIFGIDVFVKYDPDGNLIWQTSIGGENAYAYHGQQFAVDRLGDVVVFGAYREWASFGTDSLTTERQGHYLAKLSGETGEVLWKKNLTGKNYNQGMDLDGEVVIDEDNNIYLPFTYRGFTLEFDQLSLESDRSPVNAIASFFPDGELRWGKVTATPWTDYYGRTHVFAYDSSHQRLVMCQSQGFYNVLSSCAYHDWDYFIQYLDKDGLLIDTFSFTGTDLGSLTTGVINQKGIFQGFGYHRGTLAPGEFSFTSSKEEGNCHSVEGFFISYDPDLKQIIRAASTWNASFYPLDVCSYQSHTYVYGVLDNRLTLLKFTDQWEYVGYKDIGQRVFIRNSEYWQKLDVNNGFLYLAGNNFEAEPATGINPLLPHMNKLSILKLADSDWSGGDNLFEKKFPSAQPNGPTIRLYPNPVSGNTVRVVMMGEKANFTHFELFNLQGQYLDGGTLTDLPIQELSLLPHLPSGLYILKLNGPGQSESVKLQKQ